MNFLQKAILRYTPVSLQNVGLSLWGYQIHRFRHTRYFHRRLAELDTLERVLTYVTDHVVPRAVARD